MSKKATVVETTAFYLSNPSGASHGSIRMMPADILDLFGRVVVGTPVYIR